MTNAVPGAVDYSRVFFGGSLMLWGALLLLDQTGVADLSGLWPYWPLWLVLWGAVKLVFPGHRRRSGAWLVLVGAVLLADSLHVASLRQSWPLFVVAAGASMAWNSMRSPGEVPRGR